MVLSVYLRFNHSYLIIGHLNSKRNTHRADPEWDLARYRDVYKLAHLSDWQAKDVEDASVGKVEGPNQGLTMVGGRGGMRRVEEHSIFAQQ